MKKSLSFYFLLLFFIFISGLNAATNFTAVGVKNITNPGATTFSYGDVVEIRVEGNTNEGFPPFSRRIAGTTGYNASTGFYPTAGADVTTDERNKFNLIFFDASDFMQAFPILPVAYIDVSNTHKVFQITVPYQNNSSIVSMGVGGAVYNQLYKSSNFSISVNASTNGVGDVSTAPSGYLSELTLATDVSAVPANIIAPIVNNPYNETLKIKYTLPQKATELKIIFTQNNVVNTFAQTNPTSEYLNIGTHEVSFNYNDFQSATGNDLPYDFGNSGTPSNLVSSNTGIGNPVTCEVMYKNTSGDTASQEVDFIYDNLGMVPSSVIPVDGSETQIDVSFNLLEDCSSTAGLEFWIYDSNDNKVSAFNVDGTFNTGQNTYTINGASIDSSPGFNSGIGSGNDNTLVLENTYKIAMKLIDNAGNSSNESNAGSFFYTGVGTQPVSNLSVSQVDPSLKPKMELSMTVPEEGSNFKLYVSSAPGSSSGDVGIISLSGISEGQVNLVLEYADYNENWETPGFTVQANATNVTDILDGNFSVMSELKFNHDQVYYFSVGYQDSDSNPEEKSEVIALTWDGETTVASITAPAENSYNVSSMVTGYSLPGTANASSVVLYVDDDNNFDNGFTSALDITGYNSEGNNAFLLENINSNLVGNSMISNAVPNNSLVDDAGLPKQYWIAVKYRDSKGNPPVRSGYTPFYVDFQTLSPVLNLPNTAFANVFDVQYNLPETVKEGTLYLGFRPMADSGGVPADNLSHKLIINGETNVGNNTLSGISATNLAGHTNLSLAPGYSSNALTSGTEYYIEVGCQDRSGNTLSFSQVGPYLYSSSQAVLNMEPFLFEDVPLLDQSDGDFDCFAGFKISSATGTGIRLDKFELTLGGQIDENHIDSYNFSYSQTGTAPDDFFEQVEYSVSVVDGRLIFETSNTMESHIVSGTTVEYIKIFVNLKPSALETETINATINAAVDVTAYVGLTQNTAVISGNFPFDARTYYVDGYYMIDGGDYGNAKLDLNSVNNPIFWFCLNTNQGVTSLDSISIDLSGSAVFSDFLANGFKIYQSDDNVYDSSDILVSNELSYPSGGEDNTLNFVFNQSATDLTATEKYYFLTCDVSSVANGTHNILATINASDTNPVTGYRNILDLNAGNISGGTHTLPVEMGDVNFANNERNITLSWITQTETENRGFNVYRGLTENDLKDGRAIKLNASIIDGAGTTSQPTTYSYEDSYRIEYNQPYYYWLETVDFEGYTEYTKAYTYTAVMEGNGGETHHVVVYGLNNNYPNPFNPETTISFRSKLQAPTSLIVYNVKGQRVKTLYNGIAQADKLYNVVWNGSNESGREVGAGVYFYRLKIGKDVQTKKMILLK